MDEKILKGIFTAVITAAAGALVFTETGREMTEAAGEAIAEGRRRADAAAVAAAERRLADERIEALARTLRDVGLDSRRLSVLKRSLPEGLTGEQGLALLSTFDWDSERRKAYRILFELVPPVERHYLDRAFTFPLRGLFG